MAYDEGLAERIRDVVSGHPALIEKKMFGGLGFIVQGNMACGVVGDELMVRTGPDQTDEALQEPHTRLFDMSGRPMKGWVLVAPEGYEADEDLQRWVERGMAIALALPPK
jgi:TfoX/Sxy family transcriptional regulator of competence genes